MACEGGHAQLGRCQCKAGPPDSILLGILSTGQRSEGKWLPSSLRYHQQHHTTPGPDCPCQERRKVLVKAPDVTCKRASEVLLKTVAFIRNLPSFYELPPGDQVALIKQCWAPLFVLGLAQEKVDFDTKDISAPSLLKQILLNQSECDMARFEPQGAPYTEVQRMKSFLDRVWSLDICAKEYAYLKGIVLFNHEVQGLQFPRFVQTLQEEAQHTLMEFSALAYSNSQSRLAWILGSLSILKAITASTVTELFFRPVSLEANVEELLLETLCTK
ncbi:nuclear receptor subfamily 0 group B member 2-like [Ambystoma mexicanum]|uniref:nuclear receptor subfamily 0 group B member 2-like n=1 Tax=Ambystoma mexicanum TaxID=8296 RepID=UPI0037E83248